MNEVHFNKFPSSIILHIFQYFTPKELLRLARVCKRWKHLIADRCLWQYIKFTPYPITKLQLSRIMKLYFNQHTKSLELCGKLKRNSSHAISNKVLNLLAKTSPNLIAMRIEDECLHEVNLSLLPTSLRHLHFMSCEMNLTCLSNCENMFVNLRSLLFQHCPCINEKHLRLFGKLSCLERLDLNGSYRVGDAGVRVITSNFPNLKHLRMIGCAFCSDSACMEISNGFHKLESLQIEEWTYVTQRGIDLLTSKDLKFLSVRCRQINNGQLLLQGSQTLL